jgi:predicted dehydrogenase
MSGKHLTRRDFLATSTKAAAVLGMTSMFPRTAAAARRTLGANDRITFGLIGSGGQGTHDSSVACGADNVVCAALCDVAKFRMDRTTAALTKIMEGKGHSGIKLDRYDDYRKLLDRKDIDAVIIATPDHWHRSPFVAACEAEKHIYQEKPFSYSIPQGFEMLAAAEKHPDLTIQMGTQRRSGTHYAKAKAFIDSGEAGKIMFARAYDCRNYISAPDPFAPQKGVGEKDVDWDKFQEPCEHKVKFDPWRYFAWRWYWDYANGLLTDVGVHVMDCLHMLTGNDAPNSAVCNGGVYGLKYWETPDVVNAVWDYGTHSVAFTSNFTNGFQQDGLTLYGTKATIEVRGHDIFIFSETGDRNKPLHEWKNEGPAHQHNWLECIRTGKKPNAPVQLGVSSLLPSHMAAIAYRENRKVMWDPEARKVS